LTLTRSLLTLTRSLLTLASLYEERCSELLPNPLDVIQTWGCVIYLSAPEGLYISISISPRGGYIYVIYLSAPEGLYISISPRGACVQTPSALCKKQKPQSMSDGVFSSCHAASRPHRILSNFESCL